MNAPPSPLPYSPRPKRPFFKRGLVRLAAVALVGFAIWYGVSGGHGGKQNGPAPVTVRVATVAKQTIPIAIQAVGNVVPYESVGVRARADSQVTEVHFKDGDEVNKGDLLFVLDDKELRAQGAQLEANIARDRAQLENARRQSSRAKTLAEKGFASKATRDDAGANEQVAQASLNASIAAYDSVRVQLGYTHITAPISGRTGTINVTVGNTVKANDTQPLVTINQLKPIRVQASLPQNYFEAVRNAMQAGTVTVAAMQQNDVNAEPAGDGKLDYIDNAVDQATGTFVTRAGFANEDERLLPGMFVTTTIRLGAGELAVTVPEVAIQRGQAGDYVFVIIGDKAMRREVKVARMQEGLAVIASGLEEGTVVAVDGLLALKDGSAVKVVTDTPAPPATNAETK